MSTKKAFATLLGSTIIICQQIEQDVKIMYASMLEGDFNKNMRRVDNETLGYVLKLLQELDNSDRKPYLSKKEYKMLYEITDIRNYWAHEGCIQVIYSGLFSRGKNLRKQYDLLQEDYNKLSYLAQEISKVSDEIARYYGR